MMMMMMAIRRPKKIVNVISDARVIKTRISRYDNGAYTRIHFMLQATALELTVALVHEINCDSDYDDNDKHE